MAFLYQNNPTSHAVKLINWRENPCRLFNSIRTPVDVLVDNKTDDAYGLNDIIIELNLVQ